MKVPVYVIALPEDSRQVLFKQAFIDFVLSLKLLASPIFRYAFCRPRPFESLTLRGNSLTCVGRWTATGSAVGTRHFGFSCEMARRRVSMPE